jgi:hypothetical protein
MWGTRRASRSRVACRRCVGHARQPDGLDGPDGVGVHGVDGVDGVDGHARQPERCHCVIVCSLHSAFALCCHPVLARSDICHPVLSRRASIQPSLRAFAAILSIVWDAHARSRTAPGCASVQVHTAPRAPRRVPDVAAQAQPLEAARPRLHATHTNSSPRVCARTTALGHSVSSYTSRVRARATRPPVPDTD